MEQDMDAGLKQEVFEKDIIVFKVTFLATNIPVIRKLLQQWTILKDSSGSWVRQIKLAKESQDRIRQADQERQAKLEARRQCERGSAVGKEAVIGKVRALYPYEPTPNSIGSSKQQLSCKEGNVFTALREDKKWTVVRSASVEEGYLPTSYLSQIVEEEEQTEAALPCDSLGSPPPPPPPQKKHRAEDCDLREVSTKLQFSPLGGPLDHGKTSVGENSGDGHNGAAADVTVSGQLQGSSGGPSRETAGEHLANGDGVEGFFADIDMADVSWSRIRSPRAF
jgi:hypothetical protein